MKRSSDTIRVRFAPSPTGSLHVGSLRTALYNYLYARKLDGTFILRIEDTDRARFVPGAAESMIRSLAAMGVTHDEGVFLKGQGTSDKGQGKDLKGYPELTEIGERGPYIQSERLEIYREYAETLVQDGKAYRCFCTAERLETMRAEQVAAKRMPKYDRHCLGLSPEDVAGRLAAGELSVIRMRVEDDREVSFDDLVRGQVTFRTETIDDQVLLKSDGFPTYHLANVVDDHLMEITHVIRAEEWLPSTPKHILLYEAFGWETPAFAHLPLLLNPDRSKLSKRQGDVAAEDYLAKGYLPEALVNFVALLGWNPGEGNTQEIFTQDELVERFELGNVHKAGAVFDLAKLDWMNAEYIKRLSIDELHERAKPFLEAKEWYRSWSKEYGARSKESREELTRRSLLIERDRLVKLSDVGEESPFFFADPAPTRTLLPWKKGTEEGAGVSIARAIDIISGISDQDWNRKKIGEILLEAAGDDRGGFLWPVRAALSGREKSPPPQDIAWVIGRDATLSRLKTALAALS